MTPTGAFRPIDDGTGHQRRTLRDALLMIRVRWAGAAAVLAGAVVCHLLAMARQGAGLMVIGAAVVGYNLVFRLAAGRAAGRAAAPSHSFWLGQLAADVAALTGIVFFWGGVENPIVVFYVLAVVCAALLLPARHCYLLAAFAATCLATVAVVHAAAPWLYRPLGFGVGGQYFDRWAFVGLEVVVVGAGMFAAASLRGQSRQVREISEALRASRQEMAQHEKMVAIGTMAAGVAHEVGNPLACLSSILQLLKRRPLAEEDRERLTLIEEQVGRIGQTIRHLLEFARPSSGGRVLADLDDLVEGVVKLARYSHRFRDAEIVSIRNGGLPPVRIVPQHIQQVLVNLLLNAFDAVAAQQGRAVVTVERTVEDGWVSVKVADKGVGMTEQQVRQAFEPFYTTKAPGQGTGLGLAVSYRLVEQSGGRITIDSSPGRGTVVTVSFPAAEAAPHAPAEADVLDESPVS